MPPPVLWLAVWLARWLATARMRSAAPASARIATIGGEIANNASDLRSMPIPVARYYTKVTGAVGGVNVRLSGIYGPGRLRLVRKVSSGEARATDGWTNRIHVEDCGGALHHLWKLADPAPLYRNALGNLVVRRPLFQFQPPQSAVLRPDDGQLDRGALEELLPAAYRDALALDSGSRRATEGWVRAQFLYAVSRKALPARTTSAHQPPCPRIAVYPPGPSAASMREQGAQGPVIASRTGPILSEPPRNA